VVNTFRIDTARSIAWIRYRGLTARADSSSSTGRAADSMGCSVVAVEGSCLTS
jgi:hypothetical protein